MKRLSAFSLMEMMVVLLIVSIVAAASAPMVNKKLLGAASEKSPWVWTGTNNNIAYNLNNAEQTAIIGSVNPPSAASNAKLYIDTKAGSNGVYRPQISFGHNGGANVMKFISAKNNIWLSTENTTLYNVQDTVVIGSQASGANHRAIAIGHNAFVEDVESIAIGANTRLSGSTEESIAIGSKAKIGGSRGIALGYNANAAGSGGIAIGSGTAGLANVTMDTRASGVNSIAIGRSAFARGSGAICIGGANNLRVTTASGGNSIAIGRDATNASGTNAIAIGRYANASGSSSTALGSGSKASGWSSIALGETAYATGIDSTALGYYARAEYSRSTAIGRNAKTTASNQIVLGTADDLVYIPGKLVVNQSAVLGFANGAEQSAANMAIIRSNRDGKMEILQRDGSGDWDAVLATSDRVGYDWKTALTRSDRRLKNVGKAFTGSLDKIKKLEVFNYTFKDDKDKTPRVGVMAQDLQKIFPDAVIKGEDGFLRIRMEDMFYALVNSVQELAVKFEAHDKKLEELTKQNLELQNEIVQLEKRIARLEKK